jgi:hypothetical protein
MVTPRKAAARRLSQSKNTGKPRAFKAPGSWLRMFNQKPFNSSYISAVIATRCARALSRAARTQAATDEGQSRA